MAQLTGQSRRAPSPTRGTEFPPLFRNTAKPIAPPAGHTDRLFAAKAVARAGTLRLRNPRPERDPQSCHPEQSAGREFARDCFPWLDG
jgi:hypothetical protein